MYKTLLLGFAICASMGVEAQIQPSDTFNQKQKIEEMPTDTALGSKKNAPEKIRNTTPDKVIGAPGSQTEMESTQSQGHQRKGGMNLKFHCRHGDFSSETTGNCPNDGSVLLKDGTFYCSKDELVTSEKAGKCPKCGKALSMIKRNTENSKKEKADTPRY